MSLFWWQVGVIDMRYFARWMAIRLMMHLVLIRLQGKAINYPIQTRHWLMRYIMAQEDHRRKNVFALWLHKLSMPELQQIWSQIRFQFKIGVQYLPLPPLHLHHSMARSMATIFHYRIVISNPGLLRNLNQMQRIKINCFLIALSASACANEMICTSTIYT